MKKVKFFLLDRIILFINLILKYKNILILLFFSLTPLLWFDGKLLIDRGDLNLVYDAEVFFDSLFYTWNPLVNGGQWGFQSVVLPFGFFWLFLKWIGLSLLTSEKIYFISIIFGSSFGMYTLVKEIFKENKDASLAGLVAGIFYSFNFYVMSLSPMTSAYAIMILTLPYFLFFLIKGIEKDKNWYYASMIAFTSIIASTAFFSFPIFIILLASYFLYQLVVENKRVHSLIFFIKTLALTILLNLFWILPIGWFLLSSHSTEMPTAGDLQSAVSHDSTFTSLLNVFRNMGFWGYQATFNNVPYFYYFHHYLHSNWLIIFSFLPIIMAIIGFLLFKNNKKVIFLGLFLSLVLLLNCGTTGFFKDVFLWLYVNVPGFLTFRDPNKFAILVVFVYAILIGGGVIGIKDKLLLKLKNKFNQNKLVWLSRGLVCAIVGVLLIQVWPMFNGEVVQPERGNPKTEAYLPGERNLLPDYWQQMAINLNEKKTDFKLVSLPVSKSVYMWTDWGRQGADFVNNLINKPILKVSSGTYLRQSSYEGLAENLYNFTSDFATKKKIMSLLNVRYLLSRNDIIVKFLERPTGYVRDDIKKLPGIKLEKQLGPLDLLRLNDENYLPHFYTANKIYRSEKNNIIDVVSSKEYSMRSVIYFFEQAGGKLENKEMATVLPVLEYKRINPTKYKLVFHRARGVFSLIFSESFHSDWLVYQINNDFFSLPIKTFLNNEQVFSRNNDGDQASFEQVNLFIKNGEISSVFEKKDKPSFISKEFQGTIQNDNLKNGSVFDFLRSQKRIFNADHLVANGYANSWIIDTAKICEKNPSCLVNGGNGYDFTLVVEYWPQQLFYLGLFISGVLFVVSGLILVALFLKKKNEIKQRI